MQKIVEFNNKTYKVTADRGDWFAKINGVYYSHASGPLADVISELTGKESRTMFLCDASDEEKQKLVEHLGYKFSKNKAWQSTFAHYQIKKMTNSQEE